MRCLTHDYEYQWGVGKCPYCEAAERDEKRQRYDEQVERERRQREDEAEDRRIAREEAQRERDEARHWDEFQRQKEAARELEERDARIEDRRERFLERQREQLANRWRYEAEAKLAQARELLRSGLRPQALALATDAAVLGIEAVELIGAIHKSLGDLPSYRQQLETQVGMLASLEDTDNFTQHQTRVLTEILELPKGDARTLLFARYFATANAWERFPFSIHPVLATHNELSASAYSTLVSKHCEKPYGAEFLPVLMDLPNHAPLLDRYLTTLKKQSQFPSDEISRLLESGEAQRANDLFAAMWKLVPDGPSDAFLGLVCPIGMELSDRKLQPADWKDRFSRALDAATLASLSASLISRLLDAKAMSSKVRKRVHERLLAKVARDLSSETKHQRKMLLKDGKRPASVPWYQSALFFGLLFAVPLAASAWETGRVLAIIAGIATYLLAAWFKVISNTRLFGRQRLFEWFQGRRNALAGLFRVEPKDSARSLGSINRPLPVYYFTRDVLIGLTAVVLFFVGIYAAAVREAGTRGLANASSEWTDDWEAVPPGNLARQSARLGRDDSGTPTLSFHSRGMFGTPQSEARTVVRLSGCVAQDMRVTCRGSARVIGWKEYGQVPSTLELKLATRMGSLALLPPGEKASWVLRLERTPSSLVGSPTWISRMPSGPVQAQQSRPSDQPSVRPSEQTRSATVNSAAAAIMSGGFAGLKVGSSLADASQFFGAPLIPAEQDVTAKDAAKCGWFKVSGRPGVGALVRDGKLLVFSVDTPEFQTKSGVRVGDPESRLTALFGSDAEFEADIYPGSINIYNLGLRKPTSITFHARDGKVVRVLFGSSLEKGQEAACGR